MILLPGKRRKLLADRVLLGRWGERRCEKYLQSKGFRVLCRNFRCKMGEIDLVMVGGDGAVVFVEVKTRSNEYFADAESSITAAKRGRLVRTAKYFLTIHKLQGRRCQFDAVIIVLGSEGPVEIRHYENAFVP